MVQRYVDLGPTKSRPWFKYLFGVVRVLLYSIIEFLCPQKDVI
jgi:hypothetical protein